MSPEDEFSEQEYKLQQRVAHAAENLFINGVGIAGITIFISIHLRTLPEDWQHNYTEYALLVGDAIFGLFGVALLADSRKSMVAFIKRYIQLLRLTGKSSSSLESDEL